MQKTLKSGRKININTKISLDDRDQLLDGLEYEIDDSGKISGFKSMNSTVTRWLRKGLTKGNSDGELLKWTLEERTEAFLMIQSHLMVGEEKASK